MGVYWITFRIHQNQTYDARYKALVTAVEDHLASRCWSEPTSFWVFDSDSSAAAIAASCKSAIDIKTDQVVIGSPMTKIMIVLGKVEDMKALQSIVEFAKPG